MCGILGVAGNEDEAFLRNGIAALKHRGPDANGTLTADTTLLGHTRLAVLDLTPTGAQPMTSASGRFSVSFNGEIYNYLDLRGQLAVDWRGTSDTEMLLAGFEAWGVEETLQRLVGMFALAIWDRDTGTLSLARDRLGEKPLYYLRHNGAVYFGSEVSVFRHVDGWQPTIDRQSLASLLRYSYIPAPLSIYEGLAKLPPASMLTFVPGAQAFSIKTYWSLGDQVDPDLPQDTRSFPELLREVVAGQMISDVPLGAFLSGGIDSSSIVLAMQQVSSTPVQTYTIGFKYDSHDEARYAREVARILGTDHTEVYLEGDEALDIVPQLPRLYSEPFADSSQIPTYLVSRIARESVTVALSGDGGDELFGGYNRYYASSRVFEMGQRLPAWTRRALAGTLRGLPPKFFERIESGLRSNPLTAKQVLSNIPDKVRKVATILDAQAHSDVYQQLVSQWFAPENVVLGAAAEDPTPPFLPPGLSEAEKMMFTDTLTYLPDDLLTKVDRAAMGVSLETRVPFLDHRMVRYAWQMPIDEKIRDGVGKLPLRSYLNEALPESLIDRPKMGFSIPLEHWLRGPLKSWAEALLEPDRLRQEGYFDPEPIQLKWDQHQSGQGNWQHHLWSVLMFQAWQESLP